LGNSEQIDSIKVLYEKEVDFIGDLSPDKIEITTSDFESKGVKPFILNLYENRNGKLEICKYCCINFWTKPLQMYISKVRYLDMHVLIFVLEREKGSPDSDYIIKFGLVYADRIEK
jgi:hypothetical protein